MSSSSDRTILVTGGAGYIGSHAVLACIEAGFGVVVLDDLSSGERARVPDTVTFVEGDVGDGELVRRLVRESGVGALMHFAGSIAVEESMADPAFYYLNNTVKSLALFEAALGAGVRSIIYSSTAAVYASGGQASVAEDAAIEPCSPYGRSKLAAEMILKDLCVAAEARYGLLRYFNVAGADPMGRSGQGSSASTHLIKVACEVAIQKRPLLPVFGDDYATRDGTCIRDYIHVSDLADLHVLALQRLEGGGESFTANCGYGVGATVLEVVAAFERLLQREMPVEIRPRRPGDAPMLVADSSHVRQLLGWRPRLDTLDQIIDSAYRWEQSR